MAIKNVGSTKSRSPKSNSVATAGMAIAGRSSRACDVCGLQRAHWYCAADEAFLCEKCDTGVHSANAVALRHERVRLTSNGTPVKLPRHSTSHHLSNTSRKGAKEAVGAAALALQPPADRNQRQVPPPPAVVLPSSIRSRSSRPHPHHRAQSRWKICKSSKNSERVHDQKVKVEFVDQFELSDEVVDSGGAHEVPEFIPVIPDSNEFDIPPPGYMNTNGSFLHYGDSASPDKLIGFFKAKAAQELSQGNLRRDEANQFVVPDSFDDCLDSGVDISVNIDGPVLLIGNSSSSASFRGGDIPGLVIDGFDGFDVDYGLNLDVTIGGGSDDPFLGDNGPDGDAISESHGCFNSTTSNDGCGSSRADRWQSWDLERIPATPSPFARFLTSSRVNTEEDVTKELQPDPEKMKKEAEEILKCSLEGLSEEDLRHVPSLRLNYEDVLAAWSDRGALWTDGKLNPQTVPSDESFNYDTPNSCTEDICKVPDMMSQDLEQDDSARGTDDGLSNEAGREARVLRYKEKRRTRLFSKKIRYEVRKLNAERRPRMKGRFVKRMHLSP